MTDTTYQVSSLSGGISLTPCDENLDNKPDNKYKPHVSIITMGGTIDKDYPKLTSGYAFEFGDQSAAERILKSHPNLGITYSIKSVCKKDSLEINDDDREKLIREITSILEDRSLPGLPRIVVTHGTDTMIETAMCVRHSFHDRICKIAFTGATKPERFVDSDASFNVGCAVAATSSCQPCSVVICMNGNVIPVDSCVRDETTGLFRNVDEGVWSY